MLLLMSLLVSAAPVLAQDARNTVLTSRTHYTMPVFTSREAWEERAAFLRKQILASAGLLPMPEKRPLNAQIFGKLERDGYTIEKVLLETLPGFYLGGNLYRPLGKQGPFPGVVSPHGHWHYGRLENTQLVSVPGRAITLARQGYVVFIYDMIGQNDTDQIPHHWGEERYDLWSIGPMGIQLWDSIRATDFVSSLPDVDSQRIVATGASGGGTQTFFLMAVDERIKAAAPVNMISATSQGGVCENAPNLRAGWTDFSNMVVGALMAPRPLILVSNSGDWTVETPKEVFPAIQSIYRLFGAEKNVENAHFTQFIHNYNKESRQAVYRFFNEHMLKNPAPVSEPAFRVEFPNELLALFNRQRPANAVTGLEQLAQTMIQDARSGTARLQPRDATALATARDAFAERMMYSLLAFRPRAAELRSERIEALPGGEKLVIGREGKGDRVPAVWLAPSRINPAMAPTLVVHPEGVAWVTRSPLVKSILDRGGVVMGIDAFQTGSAVAPRDTKNRAYLHFNQTNDANRVQDIVTALEYLRSRSKAQTVNLVGLEMAGVWSYFARTMAGEGVNLAADLTQFAADTDAEYVKRFFIPGVRKAGDFHAAAVLNARGRALVYNAGPQFPADWARQAAKAAGSDLDLRTGSVDASDLVSWLVDGKERASSGQSGSAESGERQRHGQSWLAHERPWLGASDRLLARAFDGELLQTAAQRTGFQPERAGGPARAFDAPGRRGENAHNVVSFDRLQGGFAGARNCARRIGQAREAHVIDRHDPTRRQDDRPLNHILELANVSRPVMVLQHAHHRLRNRGHWLSQLRGKTLDEVRDQHRNVFGSFAQGRQRNRKHVQAIVEVSTEAVVADIVHQVAVCGGDDAHVDARGTAAAEPIELSLLEHSEEFRLELERKISDFVEEERSAVCQLEASSLAHARTGEGAALVPEQFALDERGGQGRTVQGDESVVAPCAPLMDRARDQLFPGAGLAEQEDGGLSCGDLVHSEHDVAPRAALANDPVLCSRRHGIGAARHGGKRRPAATTPFDDQTRGCGIGTSKKECAHSFGEVEHRRSIPRQGHEIVTAPTKTQNRRGHLRISRLPRRGDQCPDAGVPDPVQLIHRNERGLAALGRDQNRFQCGRFFNNPRLCREVDHGMLVGAACRQDFRPPSRASFHLEHGQRRIVEVHVGRQPLQCVAYLLLYGVWCRALQMRRKLRQENGQAVVIRTRQPGGKRYSHATSNS